MGGIAIAFALQNILTDIFAYFSIAFDKPFKLGDRILIGTDMGVVKKIGLKSTRIKTLQGEELIVSNKDITSGRLRNYKRMDARTVMFTIGIPYATPNKKVERISGFVASVIKPIDKASFERAHFRSFGETSLIFEIAYSIKSPKYADYLDVQQQINLGIKQKLEKEGIKMSAPK